MCFVSRPTRHFSCASHFKASPFLLATLLFCCGPLSCGECGRGYDDDDVVMASTASEGGQACKSLPSCTRDKANKQTSKNNNNNNRNRGGGGRRGFQWLLCQVHSVILGSAPH